jgi:hypothetical protein
MLHDVLALTARSIRQIRPGAAVLIALPESPERAGAASLLLLGRLTDQRGLMGLLELFAAVVVR